MLRALVALALVFGLIASSRVVAGEITGTLKDLECVFEQRDALSLGGLIDPIRLDVAGCVKMFSGGVATDRVHAGLSEPDFPLDKSAQLIAERVELTIAQIERIACHLNAWSAANPGATADAMITLDLNVECTK